MVHLLIDTVEQLLKHGRVKLSRGMQGTEIDCALHNLGIANSSLCDSAGFTVLKSREKAERFLQSI